MKFGEVPELTKKQKLLLSFLGHAFLGFQQPDGYSSKVAVYVVKCSEHGLYLDTPHGFDNHFQCSDCLAEIVKEANQ